MATIRKRGNKYEAQVRRKGFPSLTRSFHKLSDAREWARLTETKADRHDLAPDRKVLGKTALSQLVERYRDEIAIKKKGGETELIVLNAFLRHSICRKSLADLSTADFAKYRDERLQSVSPATLKRQLTPIRHMFRYARKEWDIPMGQCPLVNLTLDAPDQRRERRLRSGETEALQRAASKGRNPYVIVIAEFALETAMRRGEILGLRWADVDLERQSATILEAKNGYSRTIPLTPKAVELLNRAKALAVGDDDKEPDVSARIFPLSANGFRLAWERLVKRAKIDDLHFHDLRHEAISRLFEKGLTAPEVASISGHRDMRMLFRYAHANQSAVRAKLGAGLALETLT